jgi:hypothetical protein
MLTCRMKPFSEEKIVKECLEKVVGAAFPLSLSLSLTHNKNVYCIF